MRESMADGTEQDAASPGLHRIPDLASGWPRWRLRIGTALVLFSGFEVWSAGTPGPVLPAAMFGGGVALLVSAAFAIREWGQRTRLALVLAGVTPATASDARAGRL